MHDLLNTLYVQTQGTVLHLEHDTVKIEVEGQPARRFPLLAIDAIVVFGRVSVTPFLIQRCAEDGRTLTWLDQRGRFKARVEGHTRGNVLLRRAQHLALSSAERTLAIARQIVAAKIQNSRQLLMRSARDAILEEDRLALDEESSHLAAVLERLRDTNDLDNIRGMEGEAARGYFGVFGYMVKGDRSTMAPNGRTRRPPRDQANALLSFLYTLLRYECSSALESVGLDPQVGFLHALRPGRPSLALDLMEELRPVVADRLALTLINRRQITPAQFEATPGGAVLLNEDGRRLVLTEYQKRKESELFHRAMNRAVPLGLVPHLQGRLLARHLRGDIKDYPPFLYR